MAEAPLIPYDINPELGIQRDGTPFDSKIAVDGSWVRGYKNRYQKIGGYTIIDNGTDEIIRNLFSINSEDSSIDYIGRPSSLAWIRINQDLSVSGETIVTPIGFTANVNNTWSFATISYSGIDYILAMPIQNATDISNTNPGTLYYGIVGDTAPLQPVMNGSDPVQATGGIVVSGNFILVYGSNGTIFWNDGQGLTNWPTENRIVFETTQFVTAQPVRSGQTLAALFWSLDFVALLSFQQTSGQSDPNVGTFISSYVSTQSTLLSSNSVISLDPYFYWPGNNSFYQFNASVIEYPNITNKEWFYGNLNRAQKQKVYGFVNRIFNEIWWLFPFGDATENTNAIFANVDDQANPKWWDTDQIPRSCAVSSTTQFPYPLMASSQPVQNGSTVIYPIWAHEYGWDKIQLGQTIAIRSNFETNWTIGTDVDPSLVVPIVDTYIPDIKKSGQMTVQFNLRGYPNSPAVKSPVFVIGENTEFLTPRQKGTIFSLTFTSNTVGGTYITGRNQVLLQNSGDQRRGPAAT